MGGLVSDVMVEKPLAISSSATLLAAAQMMRDADIGDLLVLNHTSLIGIVTDRDLVVRGLAAGRGPSSSIGRSASSRVATVSPSDSVEFALALMRQRAVRRLPVIAHDKPVGIVSLGDLAVMADPDSALAAICSPRPALRRLHD
jgi:CBS domain-containing protein